MIQKNATFGTFNTIHTIYGYPLQWDKKISNQAIINNDIKIITDALDSGYFLFDDTYKIIVDCGHHDIIKLIVDKINYHDIMIEAIRVSNLKVLNFILDYKNREYVMKDILFETICKGNITVLKWALENDGIQIWEEKYMNYLVLYGHINAIKFMHTNYRNIINTDNHYGCLCAAEKGHINILVWAYENNWGLPMHPELCNVAILHSQKKVLEWAISVGHKITDNIIKNTIILENIIMLEWLIDNKFLTSDSYYEFAVEKNICDVIKLFQNKMHISNRVKQNEFDVNNLFRKQLPINVDTYKKLNYKLYNL